MVHGCRCTETQQSDLAQVSAGALRSGTHGSQLGGLRFSAGVSTVLSWSVYGSQLECLRFSADVLTALS